MSNIDLIRHQSFTVTDTQKESMIYRKKYQYLFCQILNIYLNSEEQIRLKQHELDSLGLLTIFVDKIFSFFQCYKMRPEQTQKITKIYAYESLLFQQFFKQSLHPKARYLTRSTLFKQDFRVRIGYQHSAAKLISLLFDGKEVQLMHNPYNSYTQGPYRCQT